MREAPSIPLVTGLLDMGARVRAHDPAGMEQARKELPDIEYCDDPYTCAKGADAMVVVTEWVQYRALDLDRLKREMAQPLVVDLRNVYRPDEMDFRRCLEIQMPYLGPLKGFYTDWTPLTDRPGLFPEDIDTSDPWQFRNVLVR